MSSASQIIIDVPRPRERRAAPGAEALRLWLWCVAVFVVAMVLVGGATRLTGSGLSITEWKPLHGVIPPLSQADWAEEFLKYQQIPQYILENKGMTLEAFKGIFWWEWGHRMLGRVTGVVFLVPLLYFALCGAVTRSVALRLSSLFALGAVQGTVGWWMVASGLQDRVSVSQYRLAIHLVLACLIYAATIWAAESFRPKETAHGEPLSLRLGALSIVGLVLAQIFMGGIVAGLHAGLTYNTWPLMDGAVLPHGLFTQPSAVLAVFEDVTTAQFVHRLTAYALLMAVVWHGFAVARHHLWTKTVRFAMALVALVMVQATLGILTLVYVVPLPLALAHQVMAVIVLGVAVAHARHIHDGTPVRDAL